MNLQFFHYINVLLIEISMFSPCVLPSSSYVHDFPRSPWQDSELPLLAPSALTELCSAFAAAALRSVEVKMARRLTEVASSLNAKDLTSALLIADG